MQISCSDLKSHLKSHNCVSREGGDFTGVGNISEYFGGASEIDGWLLDDGASGKDGWLLDGGASRIDGRLLDG